MPELPEVETVRRSLAKRAVGLSIVNVSVFQPSVAKPGPYEDFAAALRGMTFCSFARRGKYLLAHLDGSVCIVVHLRMTGRWVFSAADRPVPKHTHVIMDLSDGHQLRFTDTRRFGGMELVAAESLSGHPGLLKLGVEPLGDDFTAAELGRLTKGKKSKIKSVLLDQTLVAGLGNIYADEALFRAGIHPERVAASLEDDRIVRLHAAIRQVLEESIANNGTSFRDYVDGEGQKGQNQLSLKVYGRSGQACINCGTPLAKLRVAGRTSVFCPRCQE